MEGKRGETCVVDPIYKAYVHSDDQIIHAPLLHFGSQRICLLRFCATDLFVPLTRLCIHFEYLVNAISSYTIPLLNVAIRVSLYRDGMVYDLPNLGMKSKLAKMVIFRSYSGDDVRLWMVRYNRLSFTIKSINPQ